MHHPIADVDWLYVCHNKDGHRRLNLAGVWKAMVASIAIYLIVAAKSNPFLHAVECFPKELCQSKSLMQLASH